VSEGGKKQKRLVILAELRTLHGCSERFCRPMKSEGMNNHKASGSAERRPGRPRAIPQALIPKVISLYRQGLGYRAVARELRKEGLSVDWSTIRRVIKSQRERGAEQEWL